MMIDSVETWAAAAAAVLGGGLVKIVEKLLSKRSEVFHESQKIRDELRLEIESLRTELERYRSDLDEWKKEADDWRAKYWVQVEENVQLIAENRRLAGITPVSGSM